MIEVNNLTTNPIDEFFLKKVAQKILKDERQKRCNLSIALIGPQKMRKLNKKYRGENRVTDVLAFSQNQRLKIKTQSLPALKEIGLGEIVICLKEVKKNAKKFKSIFKKELANCLIHGILHLLGYNHEKSNKGARKMEEKQKYYFSKIFQS